MAQAGKIARGAMSRDPKRETDVKGGEGGDAAKAAARLARRTPTERLSPGVYRSASGDLVTQSGKPIRRQPQAPMAQQVAGMQQGMGGPIASGTQNGMAQQIAGQQVSQQEQEAMRAAYLASGMGGGMQNQPLQMTPEQSRAAIEAISGMGKTPPGWPGGQINDMMLRRPQYDPSLNQGPMQSWTYRNPNMPQMPQASANMGGQYRLSPGVYGTREQAMNQYNQQMQDMMAQYRMPSVPQQRRG